MSNELRPFKKDDAEGVKNLILSVLTKEYPFDKSAYSDSDLDKIGEVYGGVKDAFFVIEDSGKIVGTVGIKEDGSTESLLRRLFVDSGYRKKGYGTKLLKTAIDFCRGKGYKHIYFRCTDRMTDAMKLCEKAGFKEIETLSVSGFNIHKLALAI